MAAVKQLTLLRSCDSETSLIRGSGAAAANGRSRPASVRRCHAAVGAPERRCERNSTQYTASVKPAVIPQIPVEPELRADIEFVLRPGETLTDFVAATVRKTITSRRVQTEFHARARAASEAYHRTGVSVPVETVLKKLQSKLDAKRKKLGR